MAVTVDFGKCSACQENNAKSNRVCRKCNAELPWAKKKAKPVKAAAPAAGRAAVNTRSAPDIDWGLFVVSLISFGIPIIGYFLWRSYSESDEKYASATGWAALLGVLAHILRIMARVAVHTAGPS
jgi:hypothetical protein